MNAIVTGARRGIGRAIAEKFVKEFNQICDEMAKDAQVDNGRNHGGDEAGNETPWIIPIEMNLSDEDSIKAAFKTIADTKDSDGNKENIDILVNCAGVASSGLMQMTSMDTLREVMEVNFIGQMSLTQKVSKVMMRQYKKDNGNYSIVNIGSVGGIEAREGYLAYGSSKAAFMWATRCISKELAPYNIRVNAVAPGLIDTDMGDFKKDEEQEKILQSISMKRKGTPEEIAEVVYFLATDASSFITGSIINADGGRLI